MTKSGIRTIIDYNNYRNRLQNYANQEVLKSIGYEPVTIVNYNKVHKNSLSKGNINNG